MIKREKGGKFAKGKAGGPGRPKKADDVRHAAKLTRTEAEAHLTRFLQMDVIELETILKDKKRKNIEHMIGRIVLMGIKNGDQQRLDFMLNRLIGKVSDKIEVSAKPRIVKNLDGGGVTLLMEGEESE